MHTPTNPPTSVATPDIRGYELGPYSTNSYVIPSPDDKSCWIVDPSFDCEPLLDDVRARGLRPAGIVLTHAHCDHIAGIPDVLRAFPGLPILVHEAERDWLGEPELNLSAFSGMPVSVPGPTGTFRDGDMLDLGGMPWRVIHTPGHSPGGVALYHEPSGTALVGDALFAGSIGRTDFPGADHDTLLHSIRTRLYTLPDSTVILPGHGPKSTIAREKRSNPFVRA
ncbi:MAG: hydroxyacylglutathione hydrolase [Phycisphaerae bacterium]|nr:MAG: hydroxyacylglutathione hydrolase [Phycisphaerae bacterium]